MQIPVFCSLLPTELIKACGGELHFIKAEELVNSGVGEYHCSFHENLCSYAKTLYDYFLENRSNFDLIIIPTSCDAMKKLYNSLKAKLPAEKIHLLDIPQIKGELARKFLLREFEKLSDRLRTHACHSCEGRNPGALSAIDFSFCGNDADGAAQIGILGSNVPMKSLETSFKRFGFEPMFLNHCTNKAYPQENLLEALNNDGLEAYAGMYLQKHSCPRTHDEEYKKNIVKKIKEEKLAGIIINALKFCDFHPFDHKYFKKVLGDDFPILFMEHELTASFEGQTMTRIEAFFENIQKRLGRTKGYVTGGKEGNYFVGIDSGSHATKLVCIDGKKNIVCREVVPTGTSVKKSAEDLLNMLNSRHKIEAKDIAAIIGTGYGRNNIDCADDVVTEISCHALGAHYILNRAGTIIDIGGQDSKAIKIDDDGGVVRFAMNDKCAAGTGRFLEVMASKLQMTLEEFSELAFNAPKHVTISSMCSVFAESEVISLIAGGSSKEEIAKGIHKAIAQRTIALAKRIDGAPPYYMAGGVAKNKGLVSELETCLGEKLEVIDYPQFSGALGAALVALRNSREQ